ncbi:hypothetical protein EVAR_36642_1 [Eumeta japonica]|uniref:Uncharacterized protein n=1 Tax=Eumeta variegata TaxID=151549 RepID=A0A4C1YPH4_EUMVA|nr:hypothetical protein EVAR_36642_1 [Eumeta japonica]
MESSTEPSTESRARRIGIENRTEVGFDSGMAIRVTIKIWTVAVDKEVDFGVKLDRCHGHILDVNSGSIVRSSPHLALDFSACLDTDLRQ